MNWGTSFLIQLPNLYARPKHNYGTIDLISAASKIFSVPLLSRSSTVIDARIHVNHEGFNHNSYCLNQIFIPRRVLECY